MPKRTEEEWERHRFPRESQLQTYITKRINEYRAKYSTIIKMMKIADRHNSGISDFLLCIGGTFVAVELKIGANKPTALQKQFIKEINEAGGITGVAWNWGDFKKIVNPVLKLHKAPLLDG